MGRWSTARGAVWPRWPRVFYGARRAAGVRQLGLPLSLSGAPRRSGVVRGCGRRRVRINETSLNLSLRHEVARLIVWHAVSTRPVVPSTVSYEDVREGNDPYRALGHGTHSHWTGTRTVRGRCIGSSPGPL